MDSVVLVINPGSSSKKYALYQGTERLVAAHFEHETGGFVSSVTIGTETAQNIVTDTEYADATRALVKLLIQKKVISKAEDINRIAIRIVAPGKAFQANRIITDAVLKELKAAEERAPLHVGPVLTELKSLNTHLPRATIVGISDSAFHADLPDHARRYAIPREDAEKFQVYRFGYHGISLSSIARQLWEGGALKPRTIVCHLGSGSSVTALRDGQSIDTTMGFTPLEGLEMATRDGDIDAGAVLYLQEKLKFTPAQMADYLNRKSGLLGVSGGESADMRDLLANIAKGDEPASQAVGLYVYRIQKYIGAYTVALGGLDLLIFSGTIGERSSAIRTQICAGLGVLGITLDAAANEACSGTEAEIGARGNVAVRVVATDEVAEIARQALTV